MEQPEKELVAPVVHLLAGAGYPVVLSAALGEGYTGRGEFAIRSPSTDRVRRADVVAGRWIFDGTAQTVAIECKATVAAVYDALGQAVDYQSLFDEVYIATPLEPESLGFVRSTLVELGIGHITVTKADQTAAVTVSPVPRWPSRFHPHRRHTVDWRLALGLAFREVAQAEGLRFGFFGEGQSLGVWYAEEVLGHVQWNCWCSAGDTTEVFAGINVEHVQDIRELVNHVDEAVLASAFAKLTPDLRLRVDYIPVPNHAGATVVPRLEGRANQVAVADVLAALLDYPQRSKPQLQINRKMDTVRRGEITRADWSAFLHGVRLDLQDVMQCLRAARDAR